MEEHVKVHAVRLFTIADQVLEMIERRGGVLGLVELAPPEDGDQSAPTPEELQEAVMLLIRLGFIERVDRSGGA
jgi:hypothetical protein